MKAFNESLRGALEQALVDEDNPMKIHGSGHRRLSYQLKPLATNVLIDTLIQFAPLNPMGHQSDYEDVAFRREYWVLLKRGSIKHYIGKIQRKPKPILTFTEKLYQPDEQMLAGRVIQCATEVCPSIKVTYDYGSNKKNQEG